MIDPPFVASSGFQSLPRESRWKVVDRELLVRGGGAGAGLGMGDDGRDGDEASHGTLSLSPPGTRVIGSDRRSGCCGDRKGGQNARKVYIGQAGQIADVAVVRARRLTRFSTGSRLARKNGEGESLHMYELHAHSTHTPRKRRHRAAAAARI